MSSFLSLFGQRDENIVAVVKRLIRLLKIKVSDASIEENLLSHPDFPSLFSISDCFDRWRIDNAALKLDRESFAELEAPFITSVRKEDQMNFVVVTKITDAEVVVSFDDGKIRMPKEDFFQVWSGSVLLAEKNDYSGENNFEEKKKQERLDSVGLVSLILGAGVLLLYVIINWRVYSWQSISVGIIYILGIMVSALLVSIQNGSSNIDICKHGDKSDCNLVLSSNSSHIFGISLSEIGIFFFSFNFIILSYASGDIHSNYFSILGIISLISLPFTLFSIYYQWKVVKSWCILCLSVQVMLWLNFILTYKYIDLTNPIFGAITDSLLVAFLLGCIQLGLTPILKKSKEYKKWKFQYLQLKTNKELFLNHLRGQPPMPKLHRNPKALVLGNPLAEHTITIITNPFCEPCAKRHKELEEVLRSSEKIKIEMIFYASTGKSQQVAQHFLSLYYSGKNVSEALDFWYGKNGRDFASLKKVFPSPQNDQYLEEVEQHYQWCIDSKIPHTPFLYINSFQAPTSYNIEEVSLLLSSLSSAGIEKALVE